MKPLEKIIIGTAVVIGFGFLAQQCSQSLIELKHNLPPRSYSVNCEPTEQQQLYTLQIKNNYK